LPCTEDDSKDEQHGLIHNVQFKKMKKKLEENGITYEGPEDAENRYDDVQMR
jgi:hypothetical protein